MPSVLKIPSLHTRWRHTHTKPEALSQPSMLSVHIRALIRPSVLDAVRLGMQALVPPAMLLSSMLACIIAMLLAGQRCANVLTS